MEKKVGRGCHGRGWWIWSLLEVGQTLERDRVGSEEEEEEEE